MVVMLGVDSALMLIVSLGALALAVWAAADAVFRPAAFYPAAGKLTKPAWVAITVVAVLVLLSIGVFSLFGIVASVAAIVYIVDVRPALQQLKPGNGPYG
jgi:hypothetical protein